MECYGFKYQSLFRQPMIYFNVFSASTKNVCQFAKCLCWEFITEMCKKSMKHFFSNSFNNIHCYARNKEKYWVFVHLVRVVFIQNQFIEACGNLRM